MHYQKEGQFQIKKKSVGTILRQYKIANFDYKLATQGIENTTIIVDTSSGKYVLRIYRYGNKTIDEIGLEVSFMDFLKKHELPIPVVYKNSIGSQISTINIDSKIWYALLMEFIDGEHKDVYTPELVKQLASDQAKMHKAGIEFAKLNPASSSLNIIKEHEFIHQIDIDTLGNERLKGLLSRGKKYQYKLNGSVPKGYCHLDYDAENVLADSNDQIRAILDFDDLTYTSVVVCLAFTLQSVLIVNDDWKLLSKYIVKLPF